MSTLFRDWLEGYNKSTTSRTQTPPIRFVVDFLEAFDLSTTNPQHDMSRCCGFAVQLSICCGLVVDFVVQLVVQQIHNKSNRWSLTIRGENRVFVKSKCYSSRFTHI